jgi:hypothetical protein
VKESVLKPRTASAAADTPCHRVSLGGQDKKMAYPQGFEPRTFWSVARQGSFASLDNAEVTEAKDSACTNACTESADSGHEIALKTLADTIRGLTPEDRDALIEMLQHVES